MTTIETTTLDLNATAPHPRTIILRDDETGRVTYYERSGYYDGEPKRVDAPGSMPKVDVQTSTVPPADSPQPPDWWQDRWTIAILRDRNDILRAKLDAEKKLRKDADDVRDVLIERLRYIREELRIAVNTERYPLRVKSTIILINGVLADYAGEGFRPPMTINWKKAAERLRTTLDGIVDHARDNGATAVDSYKTGGLTFNETVDGLVALRSPRQLDNGQPLNGARYYYLEPAHCATNIGRLVQGKRCTRWQIATSVWCNVDDDRDRLKEGNVYHYYADAMKACDEANGEVL